MPNKITAGVVGYPIKQSLSPLIHAHWYEKAGIHGAFEKIEVPPDGQSFEDKINALLQHGYAGVNVTIPFKSRAFELATSHSDEAKFLGVANTLIFKDGHIHAENTDKIGFQTALMAGIAQHEIDQTAIKKIAVIGAGGAAPAILLALKDIGFTHSDLANRTIEKAIRLKDRFEGVFDISPITLDAARAKIDQYDLVINTSSLGMDGQPALNLEFTANAKTKFVVDIVYAPLVTALMKSADMHHIPNMNGLPMLIHQARPGHHAWFGSDTTVTDEIEEKCMAALNAKTKMKDTAT